MIVEPAQPAAQILDGAPNQSADAAAVVASAFCQI